MINRDGSIRILNIQFVTVKNPAVCTNLQIYTIVNTTNLPEEINLQTVCEFVCLKTVYCKDSLNPGTQTA